MAIDQRAGPTSARTTPQPASDLDPLAKLESAICSELVQRLLCRSPFAESISQEEKPAALARLGAQLGYRYAKATLANYRIYDERQRAVIERLSRFALAMPRHLEGMGGLLLFGDAGTGKDHLVAALLKIAVGGHGLTASWFDGGDLYDRFYLACRSEGDAAFAELRRDLESPAILAISDPQPPQGLLSDSQIRRLRDVIDRRYRAGKSTWITTNLDDPALANTILTGPLLDRIKEASAKILCNWPSHRAQQEPTW